MKAARILVLLAVVLVTVAAIAFLARERIAGYWIERNLAAKLSELVGGEVKLEGVEWKNGILTASRGRVTGSRLPFESLEARGLRAPLDWDRLTDPGAGTYQIEAEALDVVWRPMGEETAWAAAGGSVKTPPIDLAVKHFSFRHADDLGWSIKDAALQARQEEGKLSCSARDGTLTLPDWKPFALEHVVAEHTTRGWHLEKFALRTHDGGTMSGSASREDGEWRGDFAWDQIEVDDLLPVSMADHFDGKQSGRAQLRQGVLSGEVRVFPAAARSVPTLAKLAGLLIGENWEVVPWETFKFKFVRDPGGALSFTELDAVSPKGLAVRGSGQIDAATISLDLNLGLQRKGRPLLTALEPVLFTQEQDGYLWAPMHVGGSLSDPRENLTARIVEAVAAAPVAAPVGDMMRAVPEVPKAAVEAADSLIKGLLGH